MFRLQPHAMLLITLRLVFWTGLCTSEQRWHRTERDAGWNNGMHDISAATQVICSARLSRAPLDVLPAEIRPADEVEAYQVQDAVHGMLTPQLGPVVGHKVGCTTPVMQHYLGIASPCAGAIFATGVHHSPATLNANDYGRIGVECEIAVRIGRDLLPSNARYTPEDVARAVEAYMPAIEIVDDRYVDWRRTDTPTLIADDFFAAGCVLGDAVARQDAPDLATVIGQTFVNDVAAGRGIGADVMGHPHVALAWLANHLSRWGKGLFAGEIVLTGSLVQTVWLAPGDRVTVAVSGFGSVGLDLDAPGSC